MPQKCLREVFGLGLFETMSVGCQQSHKDESKFDIDLQVKERPAKTGDIDMEWSIAPTASGRPGLSSIVPGRHLAHILGPFYTLYPSPPMASASNDDAKPCVPVKADKVSCGLEDLWDT